MFYCPYFQQFLSDDYRAVPSQVSYVRIFHASPDAPPVDVYLNDKLAVKGLTFKQFTKYLPLMPGIYGIKIYPSGSKTTPVLNRAVMIPEGIIYTMAATNKLNDLALLAIHDTSAKAKQPGKTMIRFIHLSPDAPAVDVSLPTGAVLFKDAKYKEINWYIPVDPGTFTLLVKPAGTQNVVLTVPNVVLKPDRFVTVYAVGLLDGEPALQAVIPTDGNTYLPG